MTTPRKSVPGAGSEPVEAKPTPGPWTAHQGEASLRWYIDAGEEPVAEISLGGNEKEDARLIAAAPDLAAELETSTSMLEALLVQLESWGKQSAVNACGQITRNLALLAKATGTS